MFDDLDEQIRKDIHAESTSTERMIRYVAVAVASVLLFGGLYFGVRLLD